MSHANPALTRLVAAPLLSAALILVLQARSGSGQDIDDRTGFDDGHNAQLAEKAGAESVEAVAGTARVPFS